MHAIAQRQMRKTNMPENTFNISVKQLLSIGMTCWDHLRKVNQSQLIIIIHLCGTCNLECYGRVLWKISVVPWGLLVTCTWANDFINHAFKHSSAMLHAWANSYHLTHITIMTLIMMMLTVILTMMTTTLIILVTIPGACTSIMPK